jgi:integrase
MIAKRGKHITTRRLFLTPNPAYKNINSIGFFKNCPLGKNQISNWTAAAAKEIGLDVKKRRITNHSNRSTAVSNLAEASVGENQIAKITGHSSVTSIKSYLQMSESHHSSTIQKMRLDAQELSVNQDQQLLNDSTRANVVYNNCVINNYYNS